MTHYLIKRLYDSDNCDTCGYNSAEGYRIFVDGKLKVDKTPLAHCYEGRSYSDNELIKDLLKYLDPSATIKIIN